MIVKNLKMENILIENRTFQDGYDDDDNYDPKLDGVDRFEEEQEDPDDESYDANDHLCYLIRTMFENFNLSATVDVNDDLDIEVYVFLQRKEKMKNILRAFDVVFKMKKDILPQYESEMELYESKDGFPILSFKFYFSSDDKAPF